jgi:hypothetical protein
VGVSGPAYGIVEPGDWGAPGDDCGFVGLVMVGVICDGEEQGLVGVIMTAKLLGASRTGITSKVGWKDRRVRMKELPPGGRDVREIKNFVRKELSPAQVGSGASPEGWCSPSGRVRGCGLVQAGSVPAVIRAGDWSCTPPIRCRRDEVMA